MCIEDVQNKVKYCTKFSSSQIDVTKNISILLNH